MTEDHPHDDLADAERARGQLEPRLQGALRTWLDPLEPPPPRAPVGRARLRPAGLGTLGTIAAVLLVAALVVGPRLAGQLGAPVRSPVPASLQPGAAAAPSSVPESASPPPIGSAPCLAAGASGVLCGAAGSSGASGSASSTASATVSVPVTGHATATPATRTLAPLPTSTPRVSPPPASPTASPTPGGTATAGGSPTVTLADNGKTLHLRTGEQFLLDLGLTYDWTVNVADQQVVSRVPNILVIRGAQGVYEARAAGTTTLTAAGNPVCLSAKPPCAMPSLLFRLQIVVS